MKRIFQRFKHVTIQQKSGFVTFEKHGHRFDQHTPIEILGHILSDNMQLAEPVLEEVAIDLMEYLQYYFNPDLLGD